MTTLNIPGIILSRHVLSLSADDTVFTFTYPALTNTNRKANSVFIHYPINAGNCYVSIDGTDPTFAVAATVGVNLAGNRTSGIFICGLPIIKGIKNATATGTSIEVYLCYTSMCHN